MPPTTTAMRIATSRPEQAAEQRSGRQAGGGSFDLSGHAAVWPATAACSMRMILVEAAHQPADLLDVGSAGLRSRRRCGRDR